MYSFKFLNVLPQVKYNKVNIIEMIKISIKGKTCIMNTLNIWLDGVNAFTSTLFMKQSNDNSICVADPIVCNGTIN